MTDNAKLQLYEVEIESSGSALIINRCLEGKVKLGDVVRSGEKPDGTVVLVGPVWTVARIRYRLNSDISFASAGLGTQIRLVGDEMTRISTFANIYTESPEASVSKAGSVRPDQELLPESSLKSRQMIDRQIAEALPIVTGYDLLWTDENMHRLCEELGWRIKTHFKYGADVDTGLDLARPLASWRGTNGFVNYFSWTVIDPIPKPTVTTVSYLYDAYTDLAELIESVIGAPAQRIAGVYGEVRWVFPKVIIRLYMGTQWFNIQMVNPSYQARTEGNQ
ncbi:DUF6301 family protein [Nocardia sp. IBHARD005]|uniref:DUF6301 family protein n=1 Tax=Nocardia sp. IBHARD005 TaxID=3457765 RepID=UPI0040598B26